ncbi:MAG: FAD-dependent oxidoreductase, partial [Bacteroidota bacterium]
ALHSHHHDALRHFHSTPITRTFVELDEPCWTDETSPGAWSAAAPPACAIRVSTTGQGGPGAVLETFAAGSTAVRLSAVSASERSQIAIDFLGQHFPGVAGRVVSTTSKPWHCDPRAGGGYAWPEPGGMTRARPALSQTRGRVLFAGDYLSSWNGWMEGALESGEATAAILIDRL